MDELNDSSPRLATILKTDLAKDCAALVFLFAVVLAYASELVWDGKVPFFRDLYTYFYPLRFALAESLKSGELPLWNRHMAMGFPLLADIQTGTFYPPHLLYKVIPFFDAVRSAFVLHYLVAASGAYLLCRHCGLEIAHSLIGASLFFLGGTCVSLINLLNHFQSAVWLPWAVLFWVKFLHNRSWGWFVAFVLALACQLLGGSPEIFVMSAALIWLTGLGVEPSTSIANAAGQTFWLIAAILIVVLLTAVQILPTIELILSSRRHEGIPYVEAASWSLNPWTLLNLLFLDKRVDVGLGDATQMFFGLDIPFFVSYYFGAIFIPTICLWLWFGKTEERILLGGLILGSLLIAFGRYTPVYPFLYDHIAAFRSFRYPEKLFFLTQAFLVVGAVRGLAPCLQPYDKRAGSLVFGAYGAVLLIVYLLSRFSPTMLWDFVVQQKAVPLPLHYTINNTAEVLVSLERQLAFVIALLTLFSLCHAKYIREGLFKTLFVAVVFLDLIWAHQPFQYLLKPEPIINKAKVMSAPGIPPSRLFYYPQGKNLHPSTFVIRKPVTTPFNEIVATVTSNLVPNFGLLYGFDYMQDINALAKGPYVEFLRYANPATQAKQIRLLAALNVRHVISFEALSVEGLKLVRHFPEHPSWLYEVHGFAPRSFVTQTIQREIRPNKMMEQLARSEQHSNPVVFVDHYEPIQKTDHFSARAEIVKYGNMSVTVKTVSNGAGVLTLADSYFPGWRVYVDGAEERLLRANYFFRGVAIPSGEHRVEFKYDPLSFKIGLFVSLTTALVLCLVTFILLVRARRRILATRTREPLLPVPAS